MKNHFSLVCVFVCVKRSVLFFWHDWAVCVYVFVCVCAHVWAVLSTSVNILQHNSLTSIIFVVVHTVDLCILVVK